VPGTGRAPGRLDGSRAPGAFSAQLSVPARDVRLTVAGAGSISVPVEAPQAKRMIASARAARFGRGEHGKVGKSEVALSARTSDLQSNPERGEIESARS
jgi:hypothetical protein